MLHSYHAIGWSKLETVSSSLCANFKICMGPIQSASHGQISCIILLFAWWLALPSLGRIGQDEQ